MAYYDFGNIEISLTDPRSISDAIMKINLFRRGLNKALSEIQQYLLSEGVEVARAQLVRITNRDSKDGQLYRSIQAEEFVFDESTGKGKGYITAGKGCETGKDGKSYALYVEFGTGVYAKKTESAATKQPTGLYRAQLKLPEKKSQQQTATNKKYWKYYSAKDDHYYMTAGQPPKPFMANTMYELWSRAQKKWSELIEQYVPHETE